MRPILLASIAALAMLADQRAARACEGPIPIFEAGRETGSVCPDDAAAQGLTIVDLADDWVPLVLRGQPYHATYVALANETPGKGPEWDRARQERHLELYGIPPTVGVVKARLLDDARHICNVAGPTAALQAIDRQLRLSDPKNPPSPEAMAELQRRLVCERMLPRSSSPHPVWRTEVAMIAFQRKHSIVSHGIFGEETRRALAEDSRELDFRALLRVLRARVVDASGLLEDGSALAARGTILGRRVDGDAFYIAGGDPLPNGAADLISPATEIAAMAVGWTSPGAAAAFLRARVVPRRIAVRLPPPPAYHSAHMDLRAEIDRGDVWYDLPGKTGRIESRPTLTLFTRTASGDELALVRWRTTIGGWKKELTQRGIALRFKDSDVGPRVWRDIVSSPAWIAPATTPPRTLVRRVGNTWIGDTDLLGPGYASAFGMVMMVHHQVTHPKGGKVSWFDNGIRTHGTVSYASILRGESHGCHRLFNQSAVQLASFLLRHRNHVARGLVDRPYRRIVPWQGKRVELVIPHRGSRFELSPPVPIEVLEGRVRGRYRTPPQQLVGVSPPGKR